MGEGELEGVDYLRKARGGGDFSMEEIISNIFTKGGGYSRGAINQGTAIILGNTVLKIMGFIFLVEGGWYNFCSTGSFLCGNNTCGKGHQQYF